MIIGKIDVCSLETSFSFCLRFFLECEEKIKENPRLKGKINEFHHSQHNTVTVIGERNGRVMIIIVENVESIHIYRSLVDAFLRSEDADFDVRRREVCANLKDLHDCLARIILFDQDHIATIDCIPDEEPCYSILGSGSYEVNDFLLSTVQRSSSDFRSQLDVSHCQSTEILSSVKTYPPPIGLVINISKIRDEIHFYGVYCGEEKQRLLKPKYPINAFNIFTRSERDAIKMEYTNLQMSNNELNQIIGQRWKEMSTEDKLPYLQLAEADKLRYRDEMKTAQVKKPLSDYNYFVQQEKQFITSTLAKNTSTIGKHAGERWSTIHPAEKRLYEILRAVDEAAYEKQFIL